MVAQSVCLGDSLIQRSGMTGDEVTELNREVGRLRDALVGDQAR